MIRLVDYLSQPSCFGTEGILRIVVDCGTGTTAVGLALGIVLFGYVLLHWSSIAECVFCYFLLGGRITMSAFSIHLHNCPGKVMVQGFLSC